MIGSINAINVSILINSTIVRPSLSFRVLCAAFVFNEAKIVLV